MNIFANVSDITKGNELNLKVIALENKIEKMNAQQEENKDFYEKSQDKMKKIEEIEKDEKK